MVPIKSKTFWQYVARAPWYIMAMNIVYIVMYNTVPCPGSTCYSLSYDTRDKSTMREVYRWYTYSLVHIDIPHVTVNVLATLLYGVFVEYDNLAHRCAIIHFLSIIGGAFGCGWQHRITGQNIILVGASGGAYGLLSAQIGNLIINWPDIDLMKKAIYTVTLITASIMEIVSNILWYNPKVSFSTHVGGFFTGILAGSIFMHNIRKLEWERRYRIVCWIVLTIYLSLGMVNTVV